jgi:hypothetical protein
MRTWIIAFLMFLDGALISNLYWLAFIVHPLVIIPALILSLVTTILGVLSLVDVL